MRQYDSLYLTLLLVAGAILPSALGQICRPDNLQYGNSYAVDNQAALDAIASCETVNASVVMTANYTGRFYLPNVRHINGSLSWHDFQDRIPGVRRKPSPTLIELPDLESVREGPFFENLPSITKILLPKLRTGGRLIRVRASEEVDLRSLKGGSNIRIEGDMSTLRLDALKQVNATLCICHKEECREGAPTTRALNVSLPSLEKVGSLVMDGRISHLDLPKLSNVTAYDESDYAEYGGYVSGGFELGTSGGEPLDISLPRLAHVGGGMRLVGEIKNLSMPHVKKISSFDLDTSEELFVKLGIEEAQYWIMLRGNITGIVLDDLKFATSVMVSTTVPFDCDALEKSLSTATNRTICKSPEKPSSGLSKGAKIGIGAGIGGAAVLILVGGTWFWRRRQKRNEPLKRKSNSDLPLNEILPTYGEANNQARPPEYASTAAR